ncbi:hypothetical protein ACP70R_003573 [Stipagrostis hirtigluma subsp. patula]
MMNKAASRVETQVSPKATRIHRFPPDLKGLGGPDGRYMVPSMVAIGPFHHGLPHLQAMEEVKHAAAFQLCGDSAKEVYEKIFTIVGDTRSCYTTTYGTSLVAPCLSDDVAEFAAMMFLDGCFLLKFMLDKKKPPILGLSLASWPTIVRDIYLLENQIPCVVLDTLMEFMSLEKNILSSWTDYVMSVYFLDRKDTKIPWWSMWFRTCLQIFSAKCRRLPEEKTDAADESSKRKPPHLLGLLRFRMTRGMPREKRKGELVHDRSLQRMFSNAVHLAQIGIKLTPSTATWFADVRVERKPLYGELSLSPLFLNDVVACILVNLAALEVAEVSYASSSESDGFVVSSYLSVLAMLMDREEDVQELRGRGVLCSHYSNTQALAFFKGIVQHLRLGFNYFAIVQEIDKYMHHRPVRIAVHKFIYKNYKLIAAVLPIVGVLIGIFKGLYSFKKP